VSGPVILTDEQLDALADRITERLRVAPAADAGLVDARQLAARLGVARSFVYQHAAELGGKRISKRGRLRFDLAEAMATFAASELEAPSPKPRRRRRTADANVGSILKVRS
jgi:hypothetical protein